MTAHTFAAWFKQLECGLIVRLGEKERLRAMKVSCSASRHQQ